MLFMSAAANLGVWMNRSSGLLRNLS